MITFTNVVEIDRPVGDVFAYVSDLAHTPEWNWAVSETRKTSAGPTRVGTTYEQTRTVPMRATEHLEVTVLEPRQRLTVTGTLASLPARLDYRFSPTDRGTRVVNTVELTPRGPQRLLGPVAGGRIQRAVADNLGVLKRRLETARPDG